MASMWHQTVVTGGELLTTSHLRHQGQLDVPAVQRPDVTTGTQASPFPFIFPLLKASQNSGGAPDPVLLPIQFSQRVLTMHCPDKVLLTDRPASLSEAPAPVLLTNEVFDELSKF